MLVTGKLTRNIAAARRVAFEVLEQVAGGAYASDALRALGRNLSSRDGGLATQIVLGCLRYQGQLDFLISHYSGRDAASLDAAVILALRVALLQLRYLDRIPTYAAVHDSVEFVKARKRAAAGFTNAVLRKVTREAVAWPDQAAEFSCPLWLIDRWKTHFGENEAKGIAAAALIEPQPYIRIPEGKQPPDGLETEKTDVSGAYRVIKGDLADVRLHDIGSQAIIPLLNLRSGDTYLDLCAAPGNKTLQALETPLSFALACDISERRLQEMNANCSRLVLDATDTLPLRREFQRIFIDAPCSGTGTLARNPEIKWRIRPEDPARFAKIQSTILNEAIRLLAADGRLVYATCSLEREENEDVVRRFLDKNSGIQLKGEWQRLPGHDEGDGFYAAAFEKID
jgi:16S rRNA (cytosine967-C5)-methyltransferase